MKKVLIISYYWPPSGGPGVQRWLKLTKYLSRIGVKPIVVSVNPKKATYPLLDPALAKEIAPEVEVHTTDVIDFFAAYKKATGREDVPFSGFADEKGKVSLKEKLARFVRGNFFIPDPRKGWNKFAVRKAKELIEKHNIDIAITTSPPHSSQLIGLELKKNLGIKWIADFRDPWTDIYYYDKFYPTKVSKAYDKSLEKRVLEKSDHIISVTQNWKDLYLSKSTKLKPEKITVLPNGFDLDDFKGENDQQKLDQFIITYAGTITKQYPIQGFLEAVRRFEKPVLLRFIGKWDDTTKELLQSYESEDCRLELIDYLPKHELNAYLKSTDAQIFALPKAESNKGHVSGKLFDYMGVAKPVIGIGPVDGDASRILNDTALGKMFAYEADPKDILCFLNKISQEPLALNQDRVNTFNRLEQARVIKDILERI